jgi:alpha-ketoglutarate-dependent taurine dioxygenase
MGACPGIDGSRSHRTTDTEFTYATKDGRVSLTKSPAPKPRGGGPLQLMRNDCTGIEGVPSAEAEVLIAALADHVVKPAFIYRHQWRVGDLLLWDNCTVQHRAVQDYDMPLRRLMHRTTMGGSVPV